MLTAAITAGISAVLAVIGVELDVKTIAGIAVVVKILIMAVMGFVAWRIYKKKQTGEDAPTPPSNP